MPVCERCGEREASKSKRLCHVCRSDLTRKRTGKQKKAHASLVRAAVNSKIKSAQVDNFYNRCGGLSEPSMPKFKFLEKAEREVSND